MTWEYLHLKCLLKFLLDIDVPFYRVTYQPSDFGTYFLPQTNIYKIGYGLIA